MKTAFILLASVTVASAQFAPGTTVQPQKVTPAAVSSAPVNPDATQGPLRHYQGKVAQVTSSGSLILCSQWSEQKNPKGTRKEDVIGEFFLTAHPGTLLDGAELRFYANEQGNHRLATTGGARTVRALRFAKADTAIVSRAAVPVSGLDRLGGAGGGDVDTKPKPFTGTPKLKGESGLDRPAY